MGLCRTVPGTSDPGNHRMGIQNDRPLRDGRLPVLGVIHQRIDRCLDNCNGERLPTSAADDADHGLILTCRWFPIPGSRPW
jgi:hypothetical protein